MAENIDIIVRLRNLASKQLAGIEKGLSGIGKAAVSVTKTLAGVATGLAAIGVAAATAAITGSVKVFAEFDDTMRAVGAVMGATKKEMATLTATAEKMGATTKFSASQAADGLRLLGMAGLDVQEATDALPGVLELATAGALELGTAADISTNVLSGFGLEVNKLGRVSDVLVSTFTSSNSSLVELGEAFKYVGPIAASAGADFEETIGAIGKLHDAGIKGSQAGTVLRSAMSRLLDPAGETAKIMQVLGQRIGQNTLQVLDAEGKFVGYTEVIRQLEDAGASTSEIIQLFGQEAGPGMAALLKVGSDEMSKYTDGLKTAGGTSKKIAGEMGAGIGGALREMSSAFESIQIAIGKAFNEDMMKIVKQVADIFRLLAYQITQLAEKGTLTEWAKVTMETLEAVWWAGKKVAQGFLIIGKTISTIALAASGNFEAARLSMISTFQTVDDFFGIEYGDSPQEVVFHKIKKAADDAKVSAEEAEKANREAAIGSGEVVKSQVQVEVGPSADAQLKADFIKLQAKIENEMAKLDTSYELGKVNLKTYYDERRRLIEEAVDAEIAEINRATEASGKVGKRIEADAKIFALREKLNSDLYALEAEQIQKEQELENERIEMKQKAEESKAAIAQVFKDAEARVNAANQGLLEAEFAEELGKMQERQNQEMEILKQNLASEAQVRELARQHELERDKVAQDQWRRLMEARLDIAKQVTGGMASIFSDLYELTGKKNKELFYLSKAASIAEATINIAQGITKALAQGGYYGSFMAAAVAAAGAVQIAKIASTGLAEGGEVPGRSPHKKADNIPARLTAGEWVQPVDSVNYYGKGIMEAMRRKMIPRSVFQGVSLPSSPRIGHARFASGGGVSAGPSGEGGGGGPDSDKINITNLIDPSMFSQHVQSTQGERDVMNVLTRNQFKLKQLVFNE